MKRERWAGSYPRARWDQYPCPVCKADASERCRYLSRTGEFRYLNGSHRLRNPFMQDAKRAAERQGGGR